MKTYQSEEEVCQDALFIYEGACNGVAITNSLHDMELFLLNKCSEPFSRRGVGQINTHPAIRLVLYQLCFLAGFSGLYEKNLSRIIDEAEKYCQEKIAE